MKETKIIKILKLGTASILGTIIKELGLHYVDECNLHQWIIAVHEEDMSDAEGQCKDMKLDDYMIVNIDTLICSDTSKFFK